MLSEREKTLEVLLVKGPAIIRGDVSIGGSKNSALPIIAASLLAANPVTLENIPRITDVYIMLEITKFLGAQIQWLGKNTVRIDPAELKSVPPPYELYKKIRASYYLMGVLLCRFGRVKIPMPGGCNLGPRPIDQHIKGFSLLGADIVMSRGFIEMKGKRLRGNQIYLDVKSVGATINIMLAAAQVHGRTIIQNCSKEPEIVDLANFLNAMGANIRGAGTDVIKIHGVDSLNGVNYKIIPDRIEAGTYMLAAAATRGQVLIKNVVPQHLNSVISKLREAGAIVNIDGDSIFVDGTQDLISIDINTYPYPGFPTDLQAIAAVLLTQSQGIGIITENVFADRFRYLDELKRLGAEINLSGKSAIIRGESSLTACSLQATDIRAGVACIVAGLVANGITEVTGIHHIERGYDGIEKKLRRLGADLVRVNDTTRNFMQWKRDDTSSFVSSRCY